MLIGKSVTEQDGIEAPSARFLDSLRRRRVSATVMHLDHYRTGKVAVGTDYIIMVQPMNPPEQTVNYGDNSEEIKKGRPEDFDEDAEYFDSFTLSKTYKTFRVFANELTNIANKATSIATLKPKAAKLAKYVDLVTNLIESQHKKYMGKVSFSYVKAMAKQRSQIINGVLEATCEYYPQKVPYPPASASDIFMADVASCIETFFLTDHASFAQHALKVSKKTALPQPMVTESDEPAHPLLNPLMGLAKSLDPKTMLGKKKKEDEEPVAAAAEPTQGQPLNLRDSTVVVETTNVVTPISIRDRRSEVIRAHDLAELEANENQDLWMDEYVDANNQAALDNDIAPSSTTPASGVGGAKKKSVGSAVFGSTIVVSGFLFTAILLLSRMASFQINVDADWALLILFAAYCLGLHTPRVPAKATIPVVTTTTNLPDRSGRKLLRRTLIQTGRASSRGSRLSMGSAARLSVASATSPGVEEVVVGGSTTEAILDEDMANLVTDEEVDEMDEEPLAGPMALFPEGAELGSVLNCWGKSAHTAFQIRGANYLKDKKKIPSKEFLFDVRGIDLYLTDTCPSNVGSHPAMFAGALRQVPTFIINFRLPWGVLCVYCEIPEKFVPYIQACYEPDAVDMDKLKSELDKMTPGERCACRFLMNDESEKNKTLKIVPVVVKGPWVVRQVVGGKPAIIGNKLPINYVYQKAEGEKAMYLEADLDIAASSAARGILSVARTYTQVLTLDLGFVVQGNQEDELPEQMLLGCRLHGVDPLTAPSYPPAPNNTAQEELLFAGSTVSGTDGSASGKSGSADDGSVTPMPEVEGEAAEVQ